MTSHQKGENDRAVDFIKRALAIKPDYAEAHSNLGNVLLNLRRQDEAVDYCRKALAMKPDHAEANYNLGHALLKKGQYKEGLKYTRKGGEFNFFLETFLISALVTYFGT